MKQIIRVRVIGETTDGEKVKEAVVVNAYDRLENKALTESIVAEQMSEVDDTDDDMPYGDFITKEWSDKAQRYYHLGVDRKNLIETFGKMVYHAVFAELDADERLHVMLAMLDE